MQIEIPPGYRISTVPPEEWKLLDTTDPRRFQETLMNSWMIWEERLRGQSYIIGVDVADGLGHGHDRSVIDVLRRPTPEAPAEQVAQFITDEMDPVALANVIDPIGRYYKDDDGNEALVAIETNNHGILTQSELQGHLGYTNFYVWQRLDLRNPAQRYSRSIGWVTNKRTRPMMIGYIRTALEEVDPLTGTGDVIVNSPFTISELRDFQAPEGFPSWMAEAAPGAHDDCVMALCIGLTVAYIELYGEEEPLSEKRRRLHEQKVRKQLVEEMTGNPYTAQNTAVPAEGSIYENWEESDLDQEWKRWQG